MSLRNETIGRIAIVAKDVDCEQNLFAIMEEKGVT